MAVKVLHVIPSVGSLRGGPSAVLRAMVKALVAHGCDVCVATTDDNGKGRLEVECGRLIASTDATYVYFRRNMVFYTVSWTLMGWLFRSIREWDVVHIHAVFSFPSIMAALAARRTGTPYIIRPLGTLSRWGVENRRPWLKRLSFYCLERWILAGAAAIHYTSEQERLEAEAFGVRGAGVVIPNLADCSWPKRESVVGRFRCVFPGLEGRRVVLFLSRLAAKKGLELLLPAFAAAQRHVSNMTLVLAGDGEVGFVNKLRQQAIDLGISANVLWTGPLEGEVKWAALADVDLFVLPSHSENFGFAVLEAMAMGTPVIVSDQVALHTEVSRADAGVVVHCSSKEISEAIVQLMADGDIRRSMGLRGQHLVQSTFSSSAVTDRLVSLYTQVVQGETKT